MVAESICDVLSSDKEKHDYACAFRMNKGNVSLYTVVESHRWQMSWVKQVEGK